MPKAVRQEFRGQVRQTRRCVFEARDPDGEDDPPSLNCFTCIKLQDESAGYTLQTKNKSIFQLRYLPLFERKPVSCERLEPHGHSHFAVFNPALAAKMF